MPRSTELLAAFNAGEWSKDMWARADLPKYRRACRRLRNFIPLAQGPAMRRSGTRYVARTKGDGICRLQDFQYNDEQAYQLEMGDGYVRFFRDRGAIVAPATVGAISNGSFDADVTGWTGGATWDAGTASMALTAGHGEQSVAVTAAVQHVLRFRVLGVAGTDKAALTVGTTSGGTEVLASTVYDVGWHCVDFTPASSPVYVRFTNSAGAAKVDDIALIDDAAIEIGSPYSQAILFEIMAVQTADVMFLAVDGVAPHELNRLGHAKWSLKEIVFTSKPAAWTGTSWPRAVALHEKRTVWGGPKANANRVNFSRTTALRDMTTGTLATDGMEYDISMQKVPVIAWLNAGKTLQVGATGAEINVQASTLNEAITPTNVQVRPETTVGSRRVPPVRVDRAVIFVGRSGTRLYELAYDWQGDSFAAPELTKLARHLGGGGWKQMAFQRTPEPIVWAVDHDGGLAGLLYDRNEEVTGWCVVELGGADVKVLSVAVIAGTTQDELWLVVERTIDGATVRFVEYLEYAFRPATIDDKWNAFFVDAGLSLDSPVAQALTPGTGATAQGTAGVTFTAAGAAFASGDVGREIRYRYAATDTDAAGVARRRTRTARALITGYSSATVVTATIMAAFPSTATLAASSWHLTVTAVAGLDHLEGQTVQILADGASHPDKVVTAGAVALDRPAAVAHVGLGYVSLLETLDLEQQGGQSGQGRQARVDQLALRFVDTLGARYGGTGLRDEIVFRAPGDPMDDSPPLFTGVKTVTFPVGWSDRQDGGVRIIVEQRLPLPCTLASVHPGLTVNQ